MTSYPSFVVERHEPDDDAIEMFCGQIPRTMTEDDLRLIFERFGRIYKLNILRDKHTGESRGCCFVTYVTQQSALNAQKTLHNSMILPGMHHAVQMKPADLENRNERKIFIGMISKSCDEDEIKQLFFPFGLIEECTILRDTNQRSRGCAFVTFEKRQSAVNAIQRMHHSCTMNGCSSPINVRFADTPKDKEVRKMQHKFNENLFKQTKDSSLTPLNLMLFNQLYSNAVSSINHSQSAPDRSSGDHQQNRNLPMSNILTSTLNRNRSNSMFCWQNLGAFGDHSRLINSSIDEKPTATQLLQHENQFPIRNSSTLWSQSSTDEFRLLDGFLSSSNHQLIREDLTPSGLSIQNRKQQNNNNNSQSILKNSDKQIIGPFGSNLFIYHLPSEFTDQDLAQIFSPFGNVLSAKVFLDKITNRSKCFGFVSYDNLYAAHHAIEQMNGFSIGSKRLKVQLKKTT